MACDPNGGSSSIPSRKLTHATHRETAMFLLAVLFLETFACSLLFPWIARGSNPPPAFSGDLVMWSVGVMGFQLVLVPSILLSFHHRWTYRLGVSFLLAICFWLAHWIGSYAFRVDVFVWASAAFPLGCAVGAVPFGVATWLFRFRLVHKDDTSLSQPLSISNLMGFTAGIAAVTAYAVHLSNTNSPPDGPGTRFILGLLTAGIGVASLVLLLAFWGLSKPRNFGGYAVVVFGILFCVGWAGMVVASYFFRQGILLQGAFYLSIALVSLMVHAATFAGALKMLGFEYRRIKTGMKREALPQEA